MSTWENINKSLWVRTRKDFLSQFRLLVCHYCYVELDSKTVTVDHKIPISQGGEAYQFSNLVVSCKECNSLKGNATETDFMEWKKTVHYKIKSKRLKNKTIQKQSAPFSQFFSNKQLNHIEIEEIKTPTSQEIIQLEIGKAKLLVKVNQHVSFELKEVLVETVKNVKFYQPLKKNIKVNVLIRKGYFLFHFKTIKGRLKLLGRIKGNEMHLKIVDCGVKDLI